MPIYTIRNASASDVAVIAEHRVAMFREMGQIATDACAVALREASFLAIGEAMASRTYLGWLAADEQDRVIAGAGVHLKPQLPRVGPQGTVVATGPIPLVVNVYTEPAYRRRGIARMLMDALMQWAAASGCDRVLLHASEAGRPLYTELGFVPTNEMRWIPPLS